MNILTEFLRWIWWGLVYLIVALVAALVVFPLPVLSLWLKVAVYGVFLWGIALDVQHKWANRPDRPNRPTGGNPERSPA